MKGLRGDPAFLDGATDGACAAAFGGIFDDVLDADLHYTLGELMNVSYLVASEKLFKCMAREFVGLDCAEVLVPVEVV